MPGTRYYSVVNPHTSVLSLTTINSKSVLPGRKAEAPGHWLQWLSEALASSEALGGMTDLRTLRGTGEEQGTHFLCGKVMAFLGTHHFTLVSTSFLHLMCRAWARPGDRDKVRLGLKGVKTGETDCVSNKICLEQDSLR